MITSTEPTIAKVAAKGICVGCGACEVATDGRIPVRRNALGIQQVELAGAAPDDLARASAACPFADEAASEDALAQVFLPPLPKHDPRLGGFIASHAARVTAGEDVGLSSSGGLTRPRPTTARRSTSTARTSAPCRPSSASIASARSGTSCSKS